MNGQLSMSHTSGPLGAARRPVAANEAAVARFLDLGAAEAEFQEAMRAYKARSGRMFPGQ